MKTVSEQSVRLAAECMLVVSLAAGCAISSGEPGSQPNTYGVDFYEPFDNARSYGPAFLVGPPNRPRQFSNDEGARSSGHSIVLARPANSAPSIPTTHPDPAPPSAPVGPPDE